MIKQNVSAGMGAVALAVTVALAGCNGGGGSTASTPDSAISGIVTGFGSVYVNGVEYETSGASYSVDGAPGNDDYDLDVGMKVCIQGSVNPDGITGSARSIDYADELEGVVLDVADLLPDGTGTMNIMGQTVMLSLLTVFESHVAGIVSVNDIVAGNVVEVSGHSSGTGNIMASRIEVKASDLAGYGGEIELKGLVSAIDPAAETFDIGQLTVDYSAAVRDDLPADPAAWEGLYVEAKSVGAPVDNGDGTFTLAATKVEREGDGDMGMCAGEGDEVELRGIIMAVASPTDFMLDGQAVRIVAEDGSSGEDNRITSVDATMIGQMVEAEGYIDAAGVLVAHEVNLEDGDDSGLTVYRGYVQSIDTAGGTVTLQDGTTVSVTNNTILQDSTGVEHYFDLADLHSGDYVEVHVYTDANGALVAAKLEREDAPIV